LVPSTATALSADQSGFGAKADELSAGPPQRRRIAAAELGNGLVIGRESVQQPHHFDVALALALQTPG
jgi:hypothetical protein